MTSRFSPWKKQQLYACLGEYNKEFKHEVYLLSLTTPPWGNVIVLALFIQIVAQCMN